MNEVIEIRRLQKLVNETIRRLSKKYDLPEELIGTILAEYSDMMAGELMWRAVISQN